MIVYFCTAVFIWYLILSFFLLKIIPTRTGNNRPDNRGPDPNNDVDLVVPPKTKFRFTKGIGILYLIGTLHTMFLVLNTSISIAAVVFTSDGFYTVEFPTASDDPSLAQSDNPFITWELMYASTGLVECVLWWTYVLMARSKPKLFVTYRVVKTKTSVATFTSSNSTAMSYKVSKHGTGSKYDMVSDREESGSVTETDPNVNAFSSSKKNLSTNASSSSKVNLSSHNIASSSSKTTPVGSLQNHEVSYLIHRQHSSENLQSSQFGQDTATYKNQQQQILSSSLPNSFSNINLSAPQSPTTPKASTTTFTAPQKPALSSSIYPQAQVKQTPSLSGQIPPQTPQTPTAIYEPPSSFFMSPPGTPSQSQPQEHQHLYQPPSSLYISPASSPAVSNVDAPPPPTNKTTEANTKRKTQQVVHPAIVRITTGGSGTTVSRKKSGESLKEESVGTESLLNALPPTDPKRAISPDLESIYALTASTDYQYAPYGSARSENMEDEGNGSISEVVIVDDE
ncbi:hypothetical protein HK098_005205 [Nowakowskiella sp. JEL0407]|nr:hypothetical protein HK098_005205 [Nowakowskiella sp. JEL0407]